MQITLDIPELKTGRLVLRAPRQDDAAVYEAFYSDAEASKEYGGPLSFGQAWGQLAKDLGHWHLRGFGRWIMTTKSGGYPVGSCGLWHPAGWPYPELTWWVLPGERRKGYAAEASRTVIDYAYHTLGWDRVLTYMNDDNTAAVQLARQLGGVSIGREHFPDGLFRNIYRLPKG